MRHPNAWVGLGMPSGLAPDANEVTPELLADQSLVSFLLDGKPSKLQDSHLSTLCLLWRSLGLLVVATIIAATFLEVVF
jgi:hypothetical protein